MERDCRNCRYDGLLYNYNRCMNCLWAKGGHTKWKPLLRLQRAYRKVMAWLREKVK